MMPCIFGKDEKTLVHKVENRTGGKRTPKELQDQDYIVGTPNHIVDKLGQWSEAGIYRVMLQWIDLEDIEGLEVFAQQVLPQL